MSLPDVSQIAQSDTVINGKGLTRERLKAMVSSLIPGMCYLAFLAWALANGNLVSERAALLSSHLISREFSAHECGRSLALIKNLESAARRLNPHAENTASVISDVKDLVDLRLTKLERPIPESCVIPGSTISARVTQINADDTGPDTGYFRYRVEIDP